MDIGNIFSKLEGNADKLGGLLGFLGGASDHGKHWWGDGKAHTFEMLQINITDLFKDPHIPNIGHVLSCLTDGYQRNTFMTALTAWLGGYVLKEVDLDPAITKLGSALSKAGFGAALGVLAYATIMESGTGHSGGEPAGQPSRSHNGYPAGAGYSPLGRRDGGYFTMKNVPPAGTNLGAVLPASPRP
jgi:hypothetical protein